jgi:hypothetical protein
MRRLLSSPLVGVFAAVAIGASAVAPVAAARGGDVAPATAAGGLVLAGAIVSAAAPTPATRPPFQKPGIFRSTCAPSHVAMDDPILHPGMPGMSHSHEFFGNTTTSAASTYVSLRAGSTTCDRPGDTAAYWVPSLLSHGVRVPPAFAFAYYLRAGKPGKLAAPPAGLKVIAGDAKATAPQSTGVTGWKCEGVGGRLSAVPVACPGGRLVLVVDFPDCWNGVDLDSPDHRQHLAYSTARRCPAGHPVSIPQLSLRIHYRVTDISALTFASGSVYSAHADFFNAWDQSVLGGLVARFTNAPR